MFSSWQWLSTGKSRQGLVFGHQLRKAGLRWVWAPACQDHAGVGVVSLHCAPSSDPSLITPEFKEFFRLCGAVRATIPAGIGGVVHLSVVYGYQGVEEDSEKLRLTDKLLSAVLAEAQVVVCVCVRPMLSVRDLDADPGIIPCFGERNFCWSVG